MDSPITNISHLLLRVGDLERSTGWYAAALGLERRDIIDGFVAMQKPGGGLRVILTTGGVGQGDLDHIAFCVPDEAALRAWGMHLDSVGIGHDGPQQGAAGMEIKLHDPDGLEIELIAESP